MLEHLIHKRIVAFERGESNKQDFVVLSFDDGSALRIWTHAELQLFYHPPDTSGDAPAKGT